MYLGANSENGQKVYKFVIGESIMRAREIAGEIAKVYEESPVRVRVLLPLQEVELEIIRVEVEGKGIDSEVYLICPPAIEVVRS